MGNLAGGLVVAGRYWILSYRNAKTLLPRCKQFRNCLKLSLPGAERRFACEPAVRYADSLHAVEPAYLKNVWPQHKAIAKRTAAHIANNFAPKEQQCFAYLTTSLGMPDTAYQVPVFLVVETPWPGAFTFWDSTRKG